MSGLTPSQRDDLMALNAWLERACERGPVAVITGENGDMDTVGSAVALAAAHPSMMACGLHAGRLAQRMLTLHQAPFRTLSTGQQRWPSSLGGVVVVDAAAPDQVGFTLPDAPLCIVDHHATDAWSLSEEDVSIKWDVRSTTIMVAHFLHQHRPVALTPPVCEFLLAGLVTDTGRFKHAQALSFSTAALLIDASGVDYPAFVESLEQETLTASDRGAVLRGLQRAETTEAGPWSVLRTTSGTLEGKVASMLNALGCDAVVVVRHRNGRTRLTARAPRSSIVQGLHLGRLMETVAERIGGNGGGHDGAAGWSGSNDPVQAESAFINALAEQQKGVDRHDDD